jgi:hypothetical protein
MVESRNRNEEYRWENQWGTNEPQLLTDWLYVFLSFVFLSSASNDEVRNKLKG